MTMLLKMCYQFLLQTSIFSCFIILWKKDSSTSISKKDSNTLFVDQDVQLSLYSFMFIWQDCDVILTWSQCLSFITSILWYFFDLASDFVSLLVVEELQHLRNSLPDSVEVQCIKEPYSDLENCIACNDHVALIHRDLDKVFICFFSYRME